MRIKIEFSVEVNEAAWSSEYAVEMADVRRDVQLYARQAVVDQLESVGMLS